MAVPHPGRPGYVVRTVQPHQAGKNYVCPACGNPIPPGEGHVVVWPENGPHERRHWHAHCWRIEAGRFREDPLR